MFTALKMFEIVKIVPMIDTGLESGGLAAGWTLDTGHAATPHILLAEDYKYFSAANDHRCSVSPRTTYRPLFVFSHSKSVAKVF